MPVVLRVESTSLPLSREVVNQLILTFNVVMEPIFLSVMVVQVRGSFRSTYCMIANPSKFHFGLHFRF